MENLFENMKILLLQKYSALTLATNNEYAILKWVSLYGYLKKLNILPVLIKITIIFYVHLFVITKTAKNRIFEYFEHKQFFRMFS